MKEEERDKYKNEMSDFIWKKTFKKFPDTYEFAEMILNICNSLLTSITGPLTFEQKKTVMKTLIYSILEDSEVNDE